MRVARSSLFGPLLFATILFCGCYREVEQWRFVAVEELEEELPGAADAALSSAGFNDAEIAWYTNYHFALVESRRTGRPLVLLFINRTSSSEDYLRSVNESSEFRRFASRRICCLCMDKDISFLNGIEKYPYWIICDDSQAIVVDTPARVPLGKPTRVQQMVRQKREKFRNLRFVKPAEPEVSSAVLRRLGLAIGMTGNEVAMALRRGGYLGVPHRKIWRAEDGLLYCQFAGGTNVYLVPMTEATEEQVYPDYSYSRYPNRRVSAKVALFYSTGVRYDYRPLVYAYFDENDQLEDVFYIED